MKTLQPNTITVTVPTGRMPLLHHYPGQYQPQGAYIEIDTTNRTAYAEWNAEIGNAVPSDVWNRVILRVTISPYIPGQTLRKLVKSDAFQQALEAICNGHSIEQDHNGNMFGRLDGDGWRAVQNLKRICEAEEIS